MQDHSKQIIPVLNCDCIYCRNLRSYGKDPKPSLKVLAFFMWLGLICIILFVAVGFIFGWVGFKDK